MGDDISTQSNDQSCESSRSLQHLSGKQNAAIKNIVDDNSDDDLIPPTPSPAGLGHSFMKSATSLEDGTPKRRAFTNLKLSQVIRKKEEDERKKMMMKKMRDGLNDEGSSINNASAFADKIGATEERFSAENKKRNSMSNEKNNGDKRRVDCDNPKLKLPNNFHMNSRNRIFASPEISGEKSKSPPTMPSSDTTSLNKDDDARPLLAPSKIVLRKGKSFKRRASKGNSPTNKRHQGEQPIPPQVTLCTILLLYYFRSKI